MGLSEGDCKGEGPALGIEGVFCAEPSHHRIHRGRFPGMEV